MNAGGWVIMLVSVGFVTGLLIWCMHRVLTTPSATERLHGRADIDTSEDANGDEN